MVRRVIPSTRPVTDFHSKQSSPPRTSDKWVTCMLCFQCDLGTWCPCLLTASLNQASFATNQTCHALLEKAWVALQRDEKSYREDDKHNWPKCKFPGSLMEVMEGIKHSLVNALQQKIGRKPYSSLPAPPLRGRSLGRCGAGLMTSEEAAGVRRTFCFQGSLTPATSLCPSWAYFKIIIGKG